ncbi:efflux RND transporter periplasmic adaptor subunit [Sediminitomix flava]|uniref:RND family efflux transporter MFP subunit n=1 Tax=Sediminitomix flava TaxID=379075 RepID=A0A315ZHJ3_SEDFL|nr:efflux RND transporter periplasmic adaptor subunit [Sediminitomix flava]PWJ44268.1 RND family efflux transporter MFP subunit [Sediminitomix flava]
MKTINKLAFSSIFFLAACSGGNDIESLKQQLDTKKASVTTIQQEIKLIEAEIKKLDPTFGVNTAAVLVSAKTIQPEVFEHKITVRGNVESRKNIIVSSETEGRILKINALEGTKVKKGDVIIEVDADKLKDQIDEVKTSLSLATDIYAKRAALWEKNIGTEVEFLEAKNKKETLEKQLKSLKTQLSYAYVKAPFTGTIDYVEVNVGEHVGKSNPLFRIVSSDDMRVTTEVSEKYFGSIIAKDKAELEFMSIGKTLASKVKAVSTVINENTRTFTIDSNIPSSVLRDVRPNMMVKATFTDFVNEDAFVVPSDAVMKDNKGTYVYIVVTEKGRQFSSKNYVTVGSEYNNSTWIEKGLKQGDQVVTAGQFKLVEGNLIQVAK